MAGSCDGLARARAARTPAQQILEQDAPRDAVDREVVNDEQQPAGPSGAQRRRAPRAAAARVRSRLACAAAAAALDRARRAPPPAGRSASTCVQLERRSAPRGTAYAEPSRRAASAEAQAQRVVVVEHARASARRAAGPDRAGRGPREAAPGCSGGGRRDSCSKNQCWIGVSGTAPVTAPLLGGAAAVPLPTTAASSAIVGCWKSCRGVTQSAGLRARATTWMLRIESPPSSKKLSCTPDPLDAAAPRPRSRASCALDRRPAARRSAASSCGRSALRRRQRPAVDLAVGRQRQRVAAPRTPPAPCSRAAAPAGSRESSATDERAAPRRATR